MYTSEVVAALGEDAMDRIRGFLSLDSQTVVSCPPYVASLVARR